MKISDNGIAKLMEWEGTILHVYNDAAGLPTIGVGHLIQKGEDFSNGITHDQAFELLKKDLVRFERVVNMYVKVPLTQNQFDALVAFAFNVGTGAFLDSTLLMRLNCREYNSVPEQLMRWTKAGGKQVAGLVNRRQNEIELWEAHNGNS